MPTPWGISLGQRNHRKARLPLSRLRMGELRDQAKISRLGGNRILAEPDAVGKQGVTARVHDAVESGVPGFSEGVVGMLGCRLELFLYFDERLRQLAYLIRTK